MVKMRIPIREQLGALVLLASLIGLAVISIATWITNHNFVLDIRSSRLSLTASLKAAQLASNLLLMQSSVRSASTRVLIQQSLQRYNAGNNTDENWDRSQSDLGAGLEGGNLLLQAQIFPSSGNGPAGSRPLLNATNAAVDGRIKLPYTHADGSPVFLGDQELGFPPNLYPNLTYGSIPFNNTFQEVRAYFNGETLDETSTLLLGPLQVNESFSLVSMTMPIINNTSAIDILGWLCVVIDARLISQVLEAREGLDTSGVTLLVGPANATNHFPPGVLYTSNNGSPPPDVGVHFVMPANNTGNGHPHHTYGTANPPFSYSQFPAVKRAVTTDTGRVNNAGSLISTHNEEGKNIAAGFAMPNTDMCDWVVIVAQAHWEVWQPIGRLRNVLLACIFGTLGAMLLLTFPIAHYSSSPIRRLRDATRRTVEPPGFGTDEISSESSGDHNGTGDDDEANQVARKEGFMAQISQWRHGVRLTKAERKEEAKRRQFRIPSKVKDRKHFIQDELTDLTQTFNEMSDELMMQYEKLEERVQQRTAELELAKKAAEAANESKTLFIANISHELKTPLNGIMGMTAVCMSEDDPVKIKRSLGIIYKSGDLLLNLLTDLLTFSKNQVGQQLSLDEKEFRLRDISSQVLAIFDKQARDSEIDLQVVFEGPADTNINGPGWLSDRGRLGPFGIGRVKDMVLWGDVHRILQVVINLVSNSLKFTPRGGSVVLTIRCTGEADDCFTNRSRHGSLQSRQHSGRNSRQVSRLPSGSEVSVATSKPTDTANEINVMDHTAGYAHVLRNEQTPSPSPPPGRILMFEFEVRDTGPGIPESQQKRIFEPFVQGDLGLSKKYGGTGLGLSICSQLAGLMKGSIGVRSELGHGSTFTMAIPLRHVTNRADSTASSSIVNLESRRNSASMDEPRTPARGADDAVSSRSVPPATNAGPVAFESDSKPRLVGLSAPFFAPNPPLESPGSQMAAMERVAAEATKRGDKVRVLVAEDNKTNQEVVLRMLKLEDIFDVTVAQDGQEAFEKVKESMENHHPYNLIFMDIQMPNLDGLQSTRLIRQTGYSAPIVALSAYAEDSNIKECMDSGMNDFISKPIRRPRLKQVLKTYCQPIPELDENETVSPAQAPAASSSSPPPSQPQSKGTTVGPSSFDFAPPREGDSRVESPSISPLSGPPSASEPLPPTT